MTFELLKGLALGSITVEELSQELIQKLGDVSKAEANALVEAAKLVLEQAIKDGDDALDARVKLIEQSIGEGDIKQAIEDLQGEVANLKLEDTRIEGLVTTLEEKVDGHISAYTTKVGELVQKDEALQGEIDALKATVGGKNNATQVFATMEEFEAYAAEKQESLIKGDMAYVISVKKSYIYNPGVVAVALESPNPPEGWMFFDEISTELDLADYAKKAEVTEELAKKAEKVHTHEMNEVNGLNDALAGKADAGHVHEISEVTGLTEALEAKLEAADLTVLEGKVDANEAAITKLNANEETEGSVDYKIKQVKDALDAVDAGLRTDLTQAQEDILANAAEIAKLTAKEFILTRKQELVDVVDSQTEYVLTGAGVSENFIADVFVNSVRLVEGVDKDYTLVGKTLTLNKARSAGSVIQVLFTFISNAPQA